MRNTALRRPFGGDGCIAGVNLTRTVLRDREPQSSSIDVIFCSAKRVAVYFFPYNHKQRNTDCGQKQNSCTNSSCGSCLHPFDAPPHAPDGRAEGSQQP